MQGPAPVLLEAAGDAGAWRAGVAALHVAAAAALLAWMPAWPAAIAAAVVAWAGVAAWRALSQRAAVALRWDGQGWWLGERAVHPGVAIDLGGWMLLRLRPADGAARVPFPRADWLPLSASRAGAAWPALRAALFAAPRAANGGTGGVPA